MPLLSCFLSSKRPTAILLGGLTLSGNTAWGRMCTCECVHVCVCVRERESVCVRERDACLCGDECNCKPPQVPRSEHWALPGAGDALRTQGVQHAAGANHCDLKAHCQLKACSMTHSELKACSLTHSELKACSMQQVRTTGVQEANKKKRSNINKFL